MNEKNIKALLKGLGIPDSTITEAEKDDFDPSKVIADYNSSQKAHYHDIIKNEIAPGIEDEAATKVEGKWLKTLVNDLKKTFGIPSEKLTDLPTVHEKLKFVKAHLDETYSKNPNADEIRKLQEEKMEWQNKYTDYEQKFNTEIENVKKVEQQKTVLKLADIELQKKFNSIPAEKLVGKTHAPGYYVGMKAELFNKYDFGLDDKENPIPFEKGTSKRATAKNAEGKEYFVSVDDLVLTSLDSLGFLTKSNGGEGSGNSGKGGSSNGQQQQKSQKMLELEAKANKAAA